MRYNSKCVLKENNSLIFFQELKVKHLKILYKCLIGDEIDTEVLIFNLNVILKKLIKEIPHNLNFLDYFIILLEIRMSSISNKITLQLKENTTLEVNLEQFIKILRDIDLSLLSPEFFKNDITVYFRLPSLHEIAKFSSNNDEEFLYYFLDKIQIKDEILSNDIIFSQKILNQLPAKIFATIYKKIQKIILQFNQINLLSYNVHIKEPILYFNFNIDNLCLIIKLLFGNHLMALYENIFALCKIGNFTPEYIENCSPGEYLLYVKKLEEFNKASSDHTKSDQSLAPDNFGEDVYDEPLNPYQSGNLPPITSPFQG